MIRERKRREALVKEMKIKWRRVAYWRPPSHSGSDIFSCKLQEGKEYISSKTNDFQRLKYSQRQFYIREGLSV